MTVENSPIHIVHVIYALKTGGLENGLVNLINWLPAQEFRHTVISLTEHDDFAERIKRDDVSLIDLHKQPGHDLSLYLKLFKTFKSIKPDVVHTRNLSAIEAQIFAALAGVKLRIHGEHGRDYSDPDGRVKKYQWLRRFCALFIHRFIALSSELESYLKERVGIIPERVERICNGVDTDRFKPCAKPRHPRHPFGTDSLVIGYVGRMDAVKDPLNLVQAFIKLQQDHPDIKLVMIGDGAELVKARSMLEKSKISQHTWLPGEQREVPEIMQSFDIYVLPSVAEGISNTLLEAMATGLPVVATRVGGNEDLAVDGESALIVERENSQQLFVALDTYLKSPGLRKQHGQAARERVEQLFSLGAMVRQYAECYKGLHEC